MEEKLVSYDVAVLAKEVGFEGECYDCFNSRGNLFSNGWCEAIYDNNVDIPFNNYDLEKKKLDYILRPTQSLLQKYLREVHNIHIEILYIDEVLKFQAEICMMNSNTIVSDTKCGNYEDVLEEALEIALNLIKDDNN